MFVNPEIDYLIQLLKILKFPRCGSLDDFEYKLLPDASSSTRTGIELFQNLGTAVWNFAFSKWNVFTFKWCSRFSSSSIYLLVSTGTLFFTPAQKKPYWQPYWFLVRGQCELFQLYNFLDFGWYLYVLDYHRWMYPEMNTKYVFS